MTISWALSGPFSLSLISSKACCDSIGRVNFISVVTALPSRRDIAAAARTAIRIQMPMVRHG